MGMGPIRRNRLSSIPLRPTNSLELRAHPRPSYPLLGCVPAETNSVLPGDVEANDSFEIKQPLWTPELRLRKSRRLGAAPVNRQSSKENNPRYIKALHQIRMVGVSIIIDTLRTGWRI